MGAVLFYSICGGSKGVGDEDRIDGSTSALFRKRLDVPTKFGRVREEGTTDLSLSHSSALEAHSRSYHLHFITLLDTKLPGTLIVLFFFAHAIAWNPQCPGKRSVEALHDAQRGVNSHVPQRKEGLCEQIVYMASELHTVFMWQGRGFMHERRIVHIQELLCNTVQRPSASEGKTSPTKKPSNNSQA
jgi:hypothetical protein